MSAGLANAAGAKASAPPPAAAIRNSRRSISSSQTGCEGGAGAALVLRKSVLQLGFDPEGPRVVEDPVGPEGRAEVLHEQMLFVEQVARPQRHFHRRGVRQPDVGERHA